MKIETRNGNRDRECRSEAKKGDGERRRVINSNRICHKIK